MALDTLDKVRLDTSLRSASAGDRLEALLGSVGLTGSIFYCDPVNGNDNFSGTRPDNAKATLNAAIGLCTADAGDWIVVLPGDHDVTSTVELDVSGVTVAAADLGISAISGGEKFTINAASSFDDGPAVTITQPCRIIGMGIAGRETAGESLLFDADETGGFNAGFCELVNCRFAAWYGSIDAFVRMLAGQSNRLVNCTFDGLFVGAGTAFIQLETDGSIDPGFTEVIGCRFHGVGSGNHAIVHKSGDTPVSVLYAHNYLLAGFSAQGKFLDNNSCDASGLIAENWVAPLANQAAAFENLTNFAGGFANNHYEEA